MSSINGITDAHAQAVANAAQQGIEAMQHDQAQRFADIAAKAAQRIS
jgi:hypothetical protein